MRISKVAVALATVVALGCGGGGGDGDPNAADASDVPRPDADPNCAAWRLENAPLLSARLMETLPVHPERSARIEIEVAQCPNDDLAPPVVASSLEGEEMLVQPRVWRTGNDCDESVTVFRPVVVTFLYAAQWTITTESDPLVVDVQAAPAVACGASSGNCQLDCDCTGPREVCLSGSGFGGPYSACVQPCELDRDCLGTGRCRINVADIIEYVCELGPECDAVRPCPDDFDCQANMCVPTFELSSATRHACTCDAECDAPLRCAFQAGATEGRCEIVCPTESDGWCQGPHTCGPGAVEPGDAVCSFVGE